MASLLWKALGVLASFVLGFMVAAYAFKGGLSGFTTSIDWGLIILIVIALGLVGGFVYVFRREGD